MKIHNQIRELRHYGPDRQRGTTYAVDDALANVVPKLALPSMDEAARGAFRALLAYEAPTANGSLRDTLALVEARGLTVHPCDWIPDFRWSYAGRHPAVYQPWVDHLSENGFTRFHGANTLTVENCHRFSPRERGSAFRKYVCRNNSDRLDYARAFLDAQPAGTRSSLLREVNAGGSFFGVYPWQVPFIQHYLDDKAASVRRAAQELLDRGTGWNSEEQSALNIACHLKVTRTKVNFTSAPEYPTSFLFKDFCCASFDSLAKTLNLSPQELAERADINGLGPNFQMLVGISGGDEVRHIMAKRALDEGLGGEYIPHSWFKNAPPDLWRRGLEAMKTSNYVSSVSDYLGDKIGTMSAKELLAWREFDSMRLSVTREVEERKLPVNIRHDPLRNLGKIVNKEAAQIVLDEAISLGLKPDNPRLTMLKLNLTL